MFITYQVTKDKLGKLRFGLLFLFLALSAALAVFLVLTPAGRAYVRSTLLVMDILSDSSGSLLSFVTAQNTIEIVAIPDSERVIEARYFRPSTKGPHGALIFSLGYPSNIEDRQLNRLAEGFSRLGVAVLIPRLEGLRTGLLVQNDVEALISAFQWLAVQPDIDSNYIGFAGFCVGSSLALVAAEDPRINNDVVLVNVFGGYFELRSLLRAIAAHSARYRDQEYSWQPADQTVELFAWNVIHFLANPADRDIILKYYRVPSSTNQELLELSQNGRLAFTLLTTTKPWEVDALISQMPPNAMMQMAQLSPSYRIDRLRAKLFIMHDTSDPYVPLTEANRLAEAIITQDQKTYARFVLFDHVRPSQNISRLSLIKDSIRLIAFLSQILVEIMPNVEAR